MNILQKPFADDQLQTKSGNPKAPTHTMASDWVWQWAKNVPKEMISKAFRVCGINNKNRSLIDLHEPLKKLLEDDFNYKEWMNDHASLITCKIH